MNNNHNGASALAAERQGTAHLKIPHRVAGHLSDRLKTLWRERGLHGLRAWQDLLPAAADVSFVSQDEISKIARWLADPTSGQAMALQHFLAWRRDVGQLSLCGHQGFRDVRFGARLPTGVRGTPPQLEVLVASDHVVVGVHAPGLSYLTRRGSLPARSYKVVIDDATLGQWGRFLGGTDKPLGIDNARFVDAGALARFALGLHRIFPSYRKVLLYLFHEPADAGAFDLFRQHREEVEMIAELVEESPVELVIMSTDELLHSWHQLGRPEWLEGMVLDLRSRYEVSLGDLSAL